MTSHRLVADVGGTNVRVAMASGSGPIAIGKVHEGSSKTRASLLATFAACLAEAACPPPDDAVIALAGPILSEPVRITNLPWSFVIEDMRQAIGVPRLTIVNDFVAIAMAVPYLGSDMTASIGASAGDARGNIAVLGPGTGLGVACLAPTAGGSVAIPCEGGHMTLAAADSDEAEIVQWLASDRLRADGEIWNGHLSAERVLSGPGLLNLHRAVAFRQTGRLPATLPNRPEQITDAARRQADGADAGGVELATVRLFCAMLAGFAGNVALMFGATGGVMLAGNMVNALDRFIGDAGFRQRFQAKGRLAPYLAAVPLSVVRHPYPALLGLANFDTSDHPDPSLRPVRLHELRSARRD